MNNKIIPWLNDSYWILPILLFACGCVLFGGIVFGGIINVLVIGIVFGVSVFYVSLNAPRYNLIFLTATIFFIPFLIKALSLYNLPIGIAIEGLCFLMVLTLLLRGKLAGIKSLPSILLLIWLSLQFLELINPMAASMEAGFWAIRSMIPMILIYFIAYSSVASKEDAFLFLWGLLILALLSALYGLYQEFAGLPSYDYLWASFEEERYNLLFTWGRLRKFSFFFSPSEFGMVVAMVGVVGLVLSFLTTKIEFKIAAGMASLFCFWSMIYTGSRTAIVMLPIGLIIFALVTLNRKVIIGMMVILVGGAVLVLRPGASQSLYVMSTAFSGADDPSMNVRLSNQEVIKSYIQSAPFGYGLGSTGDLGKKFSPHTFVGSFPPDSEYVKIGIETGWIGLFVWCAILARLFSYLVEVYFRVQDKEWRQLMVIPIVVMFMFLVAQYPQEIFRSQLLTLIFSSMLALAAKIDQLNTESRNS